MKTRILWLLIISLGVGFACGYDDTLREYLNAHFWLPYSKTPISFAGNNVRRTTEPYAGRAASDNTNLQKLVEGYAKMADPDVPVVAPVLRQTLAAAQADSSLTDSQREELRLIDAKIEMRTAESEKTSFDGAEKKLEAFIRTAQTPRFLSEARGWLAHIYYLRGKQMEAGKIYLDELNRNGSNLSREVLLNSLKLTYGYDGGPQLLAELDKYFDTPEHAAFAIQLVTNPHWDPDEDLLKTQDAAQTQETYRRIMALLKQHSALLQSASGADALGTLTMRVALRMGDPEGALKIATELPAGAPIRKDSDFNWMLGSANFLTHNYAAAEQPLLTLFNEAPMNLTKYSAAYGLAGVYRKTGNIIQQIRFALWLNTNKDAKLEFPDPEFFAMPSIYMAYSGLDLGLLMDDEASIEDLRKFLRQYPNLSGVHVVKYSLAVRLARENRYAESAEIYESIHQTRRGPRMRQMQELYEAAAVPGANEAKYQLADFISQHSEGIYFNDALWNHQQQDALIAPTDYHLTRAEREALIAKERKLQDEQEEYWRAWQLLKEVTDAEHGSPLGRKAALLAIHCLDRISTRRFGREDDIQNAEKELIAGLRRH